MRLRQQRVQLRPRRRNHRRILLQQIKLKISLPHTLIVRVRQMGPQLPVKLLPHRLHRIAILRISQRIRSSHKPAVQHTPSPYAVKILLRPRQLPIPNLPHRLPHRSRIQAKHERSVAIGPPSSGSSPKCRELSFAIPANTCGVACSYETCCASAICDPIPHQQTPATTALTHH